MNTWPSSRAKRAVDQPIGLTGLVTATPAMAAVSIAIWVRMGTPILFRQTRVRLEGELFELYKFRTMVDEVMPDGNTLDVADRTTALGRRARRTSLDAVPELVHVDRGQMSLIGPRPLLPQLLARYSITQARRHSVRPGLTGLAQVSGRNLLSWDDKLALDVECVDRAAPTVDLRILAAPVTAVLNSLGISSADHATSPGFMSGLRRSVRVLLEGLGLKPPADGPSPLLHAPDELNDLLISPGFRVPSLTTIGFGPFWLGNRPLLNERAAVRLRHRLQQMADCGSPRLASRGAHLLAVEAKGPAGRQPGTDAEHTP